MNFLEKIDHLMARDGLNKNSLSIRSGIPYTTIDAFYKKGYSNVKMGTVRKLARAFNVTLDYLMDDDVVDDQIDAPAPWHAPLTAAYEAAEVPTRRAACNVLEIPYVDPGKRPAPIAAPAQSGNVVPFAKPAETTADSDEPEEEEVIIFDYPSAAGMPLYVESDYERISFPYRAVPSKTDFGIRISGDSMEPDIHDGDIVWVYKTPEIHNGQIGIFQLADGAVCKKARLGPDGRLERLQSLNPAYDDITGDKLRGARCVGKVLRAYRPSQ